MAHIMPFLLAVLAGGASFYELQEFNKTASEGKVPPVAAGAAGFLLGLLVAFIAPSLVLGVLVGLVGWHEVKILEHQTKERLLGMQSLVWAGFAGFVAFVGGAVVPIFAWFVLCFVAAFAGAFWLLWQENQRLIAENRTWTSENQRLLLERGARGMSGAASAPSATPAAAPAAPAAAPAPAPLPTRTTLPTGAVRKPPAWGAPQHPGTGTSGSPGPGPRPGGGDFLPRR
jgi:hypothetical protein